MNTQNLGKLEKIDLRDVWQNEAQHFTPWLSQENNVALLGDTIGIDLELEGTEKSVGPFNADILCKDTVGGHWVLIENQLERTDHNHLGQLLTYAAGLNAVSIVWIAARFTDEHRAAMDWLNEITGEKINFFGLEVELWRIGESAIAPKFNIVSKPNDWTKQVSTAARSGETASEIKELQRQFWTELKSYLEDRGGPIKPRKPLPQHWMDFAVGRTDFVLSAIVGMRDEFLSVVLRITNEQAKAYFNLLLHEKETIEEELQLTPTWNLKPERKESSIDLIWYDDPNDKTRWLEIQEVLVERLERFHEVFAPRVKGLDASKYVPPEDET